MIEKILRLVQLSMAINQSGQKDFRCHVYINESGNIAAGANDYTGNPYRENPEGQHRVSYYYPQVVTSYNFPEEQGDEDIDGCLQKLETICRNIGIDTREQYIKVKVC